MKSKLFEKRTALSAFPAVVLAVICLTATSSSPGWFTSPAQAQVRAQPQTQARTTKRVSRPVYRTIKPSRNAGIFSPSMRAAIRLKYNPPRNYIRHYLPDDRYKIGSVWRVVSTSNDRHYHRANCPTMLRESPGNVIGFASGADAIEAGYAPDAFCRPEAPVVRYASPPSPTNNRRKPRRFRPSSGSFNLPAPSAATAPAAPVRFTRQEMAARARYYADKQRYNRDLQMWLQQNRQISTIYTTLRNKEINGGVLSASEQRAYQRAQSQIYNPRPPREPEMPASMQVKLRETLNSYFRDLNVYRRDPRQ